MATPSLQVGREEAKQRRALSKALDSAIKQRAKGTGWKVSQGVLFRAFHSWFVSARPAVWLYERKTKIELHCKPMDLDPVFWEIVRTESNMSKPLSFRCFGAWTCSTPALIECELEEAGGAAALADEAVTWADAQLDRVKSWSVQHFTSMLRQHPRAQSYIATLVTTMLMSGDYDAAQTLCEQGVQRNEAGGFVISRPDLSSQTFPELALAWLENRRRSMH